MPFEKAIEIRWLFFVKKVHLYLQTLHYEKTWITNRNGI